MPYTVLKNVISLFINTVRIDFILNVILKLLLTAPTSVTDQIVPVTHNLSISTNNNSSRQPTPPRPRPCVTPALVSKTKTIYNLKFSEKKC